MCLEPSKMRTRLSTVHQSECATLCYGNNSPVLVVSTGLGNVFCKEPGSKYFWLCTSYGLCGNNSVLLLWLESSISLVGRRTWGLRVAFKYFHLERTHDTSSSTSLVRTGGPRNAVLPCLWKLGEPWWLHISNIWALNSFVFDGE